MCDDLGSLSLIFHFFCNFSILYKFDYCFVDE